MEKGLIVMYRRSNGTCGSQHVVTPDENETYANLFYKVCQRIDKEYQSDEWTITNVIKI
jgi:hypothetical protein